jgi:hypothetical protein
MFKLSLAVVVEVFHHPADFYLSDILFLQRLGFCLLPLL